MQNKRTVKMFAYNLNIPPKAAVAKLFDKAGVFDNVRKSNGF